MLVKFKSIYRRALFDDSLLGLILNPSYIARSALYNLIKGHTAYFKEVDVLDVGCGSKPYYDLFKHSRSYIGVDTNSSGHSHLGESIDVYYDGKVLPFRDEQFGGVVCFQVLEHVEDPNMLLREISRVLKDGKHILVTAPFCWSEHEQPYDFRRFTSYGISKALIEAGFDLIEVKKSTSELQAIIQLFITYLAMNLKTPWGILNVWINLFFVGPLNILAVATGYLFTSKDLYCDLVVLARKGSNECPKNL